MVTRDLPPRERRFYLEQFTGRTLVVAVDPSTSADDLAAVEGTLADLVAQGVRVVQLAGGGQHAHWQPDDAGIVSAWRRLTAHGRMRVALPDDHDVLASGVQTAARLRAFKLVLVTPHTARPTPERPVDSFRTVDPGRAAEDGLVGLAARALAGGVATVNVCHPADLAEELLTYAGAGTCYTLAAYCRVERVGIDDYDQIAELIGRGVEEGYLKPREPDDLAQLVVNGWGARVGAHLAGFAALLTEPYADEAAGELCALSTISRFAGGGVGAELVDAILRDAAREGLEQVFACTTAEPAARFFRRLGFLEVRTEELPAAKWEGYDPERRAALRGFVHHGVLVGEGDG